MHTPHVYLSVPHTRSLNVSCSAPERSLTFERVGPVPAAPFSAQEASVRITGVGRAVRSWTLSRDGSAAPPPSSPIDCGAVAGGCGPEVPITLVPYGSTHLRMTQMPFTLPP